MIRIPRTLILAAPLVLFISCGDDDPDPTNNDGDATRFEGLWRGDYFLDGPSPGTRAHAPGSLNVVTGLALLDLSAEGHTASGEIVIHDYESDDSFPVLVAGELSDESTLELEAVTEAPTAWTFTLTFVDEGHLTGTVTSPAGESGSIGFQAVPVGQLTSEPFLTLPRPAVISMCHDGENLWLSTTDVDFIAVDSTGAPVDSMRVLYLSDAYWTSSTFAFGHDRFWGTIPSGTTSDPTMSRVLPFNENGILFDGSFYLPETSNGLAHDGNDLWSLSGERPKLYRVTESGTVLDSLELPLLSAYHLDWDEQRSTFLTLSWYLNWLYEFDANGTIVAAYRLPEQEVFWFPAGLAVHGDVIYYARGYPLDETQIFRLRRTLPAVGIFTQPGSPHAR